MTLIKVDRKYNFSWEVGKQTVGKKGKKEKKGKTRLALPLQMHLAKLWGDIIGAALFC